MACQPAPAAAGGLPLRRDHRAAPALGVAHFHTSARRLGNVGVVFRGMSVARDKIVFTMEERIGNIWLMR